MTLTSDNDILNTNTPPPPPQATLEANADPAELAKFSALAHKWWDPEGDFRPLHEINPLRLGWIQERLPLAGKRVVDVGCGGGILAESMAKQGAQVLGIDLAHKSLQVAKLHQAEHSVQGLEYRAIAAEALALEMPGHFDAVTCLEMLEHVPRPAEVVAACAALCKPGGWVFFSTINRNPKSFLFAIVGAEYVLRLLPKGTHSYEKFIKPSELARDARNAGLDSADMVGLSYNPITRIYSHTADTSVNYLMAFRKPCKPL